MSIGYLHAGEPLQMSDALLLFSGQNLHTIAGELGGEGLSDPQLHRFLGDIGGKIPQIFYHCIDLIAVSADRGDLQLIQGEARQRFEVAKEELGMFLHLLRQEFDRTVLYHRLVVQSADFHLSQLRMLEHGPILKALSVVLLVHPFEPCDGYVLLGFIGDALGTGPGMGETYPRIEIPALTGEIHNPHNEMVKVVESAHHRHIGVANIIVLDVDSRIGGFLGRHLANLPIAFHILLGAILGRLHSRREEIHTAHGVEIEDGAEILLSMDKLGHRLALHIGQGISAGTGLFVFGKPVAGKVAVEIVSIQSGSGLQRYAVEIQHFALGIKVIKFPVHIVGTTLGHNPGILFGNFPYAVFRLDPHQPDDAVPIDVLGLYAGLRFVKRMGLIDRAELYRCGQIQFRTIGRDAGDTVDGEGFEQRCNLRGIPVGEQVVQKVHGAHGAGDFPGMDVAGDAQRRLFRKIAAAQIGQLEFPDVPSFPGFSQGGQPTVLRIGTDIFLQDLGNFVIPIVVVIGVGNFQDVSSFGLSLRQSGHPKGKVSSIFVLLYCIFLSNTSIWRQKLRISFPVFQRESISFLMYF